MSEPTAAFDGVMVLEDLCEGAQALESGEWVAAGFHGAAAVLDGAASAHDPFGTLFAMGLGWLVEHCDPLRRWFDDLAGDPPVIEQRSAYLAGVASHVQGLVGELEAKIEKDLGHLEGRTLEAYRVFTSGVVESMAGVGGAVSAASSAVRCAGALVETVRSTVRDVLCELVGAILSYATEAVISAGLATPWIIEQVSTRVASLTVGVAKLIKQLLASFHALHGLMQKLEASLRLLVTRMRGYQPQHLGPPKPPEWPEQNLGARIAGIEFVMAFETSVISAAAGLHAGP